MALMGSAVTVLVDGAGGWRGWTVLWMVTAGYQPREA